VVSRSSQPLLLAKPTDSVPWNDEREYHVFEFFRSSTIERTNWLIDSDFWNRFVLERTCSLPEIKHAVLALSALHRSIQFNDTKERTYALLQYGKAVQLNQQSH
jgi:hypothetical protein